jgi:hypothetical protein
MIPRKLFLTCVYFPFLFCILMYQYPRNSLCVIVIIVLCTVLRFWSALHGSLLSVVPLFAICLESIDRSSFNIQVGFVVNTISSRCRFEYADVSQHIEPLRELTFCISGGRPSYG